MLLLSPAFADAPLKKIPFYSSLEKLFRNRYKDAVVWQAIILAIDVAQLGHIAMTPSGKKPFNVGLAAQSFFFRKSITNFPFHG